MHYVIQEWKTAVSLYSVSCTSIFSTQLCLKTIFFAFTLIYISFNFSILTLIWSSIDSVSQILRGQLFSEQANFPIITAENFVSRQVSCLTKSSFKLISILLNTLFFKSIFFSLEVTSIIIQISQCLFKILALQATNTTYTNSESSG